MRPGVEMRAFLPLLVDGTDTEVPEKHSEWPTRVSGCKRNPHRGRET